MTNNERESPRAPRRRSYSRCLNCGHDEMLHNQPAGVPFGKGACNAWDCHHSDAPCKAFVGPVPDPAIACREVAGEAAQELEKALKRFDSFNSPHEGWAVIREELDELWEHVRANTGRTAEARHEAIQVAAMALRYAHDLSEAAE